MMTKKFKLTVILLFFLLFYKPVESFAELAKVVDINSNSSQGVISIQTTSKVVPRLKSWNATVKNQKVTYAVIEISHAEIDKSLLDSVVLTKKLSLSLSSIRKAVATQITATEGIRIILELNNDHNKPIEITSSSDNAIFVSVPAEKTKKQDFLSPPALVSSLDQETLVKPYKEEIKRLKDQLIQINEDIRAIKTIKSNTDNEIFQLRQKLTLRDQEMISLREKIQGVPTAQSSIMTSTQGLADLKKQLDTLSKENLQKTQSIVSLEIANEALKKQVNQTSLSTDDKLRVLEDQVQSLSTQLQKKESEVTQLNNNLQQLTLHQTDTSLKKSDMQAKLDALISQLANASQEKEKLSMEMEALKTELAVHKTSQTQGSHVTESLRQELLQKESRLKQLDSMLTESSKKLVQVQQDLQQKNLAIQDLNVKLDSLLGDKNQVSSEYGQLVVKVQNAEQNLKRKTDEVDALHLKLEALTNELHKASAVSHSHENEVNALKTILATKETEYDRNKDLVIQYKSLANDVHLKDQSISGLQEELTRVKLQLADIEKTAQLKQQELASKGQSISGLQEELTRVKLQLADAEKTTQLKQQELASKGQSVSGLQEELTRVKLQLADAEKTAQLKQQELASKGQSVSGLQEELTRVKLQLANAEKVTQLRDADVINLQNLVTSTKLANEKSISESMHLQNKIKDLEGMMNQKEQSDTVLQEQLNSLQLKVNELNTQLGIKDNELSGYKLSLADVKALSQEHALKTKTLEDKLSAYQSNFVQKENNILSLRQELDEANKELEDLSALKQENSVLISALKSEIETLKHSHNESLMKGSGLANKINALEQELLIKQDKIDDLLKSFVPLESQLKDFTTDMTAKDKKISELTNQLTIIKTQNDQHEGTKVHFQDTINVLTTDKNTLSSQIQQLNNKISELNNMLTSTNSEKENLSKQFSVLEEQKKQVETQLVNVSNNISTVKGQNTLLDKENIQKQEIINQLHGTVDDLKKLHDIQTQDLLKKSSAEVNDLKTRLQQSFQTISDLNVKMQESQQTLVDLNTKLINKDNQLAEAKKKEAEIAALQQKLYDREGIITGQLSKIALLENNIQALNLKSSTEINDLISKVQESQQTIADLNTKLINKDNQLTEAKRKEAELAALEQKLHDKEGIITGQLSKIALLENNMQALNLKSSTEINDLISKVQESQQTIADINTKLINKDNQLTEAKRKEAELAALEQKLHDKEGVITGQLSKIALLENNIQALNLKSSTEINDLISKVQESQQTIAELNNKLLDKNTQLTTLIQDKDHINKQLQEIQPIFEQSRNDLKSLQQGYDNLKIENETLKTTLTNLQGQAGILESKIAAIKPLELENTTLKKQNDLLENAKSSLELALLNEKNTLLEKLNASGTDLVQLDTANTILNNKIQELESALLGKNTQLNEATGKIASLESELEYLKWDHAENNTKFSQTIQSLETEVFNYQTMPPKIESLNTQLAALNQQIQDKMKTIDLLKNENALLKNQTNDLDSRLASYKAKDAAAFSLQERMSSLEKENNALKLDLTNAEARISMHTQDNARIKEMMTTINEDKTGQLEKIQSLQNTVAERSSELNTLTSKYNEQVTLLINKDNEINGLKTQLTSAISSKNISTDKEIQLQDLKNKLYQAEQDLETANQNLVAALQQMKDDKNFDSGELTLAQDEIKRLKGELEKLKNQKSPQNLLAMPNMDGVDSAMSLSLAMSEFNKGNEETASMVLQKLLASDPKNYQARQLLGNIYYSQGNFDLAQKEYSLGINVEALSNLGNIYKQFGKYDEAIEQYKVAINIDPTVSDLHYNLGNTYKAKKSYKDAINAYTKALNLNPSFANAYYNLGLSYTELGEFDKSKEAFKSYLSLEPHSADSEKIRSFVRMLEVKGKDNMATTAATVVK